jgi:dicarboxylate transporter 10
LERFKSSTALDVAKGLYEEGGAIALWKPGLTATVAREIVYSGCTKGMYPIVRDFIAGKGNEPTLPQRVASASATGFLGSIGANALDVVKIRQFDQPGRYAGGFLGEIAREEGLVRGLLIRGASASAPRGAAIAVGEVTTYDQVKSTLRRHYPDGFALHVVVSLITGVVATTVAAPFDLLKSRVMASADPADGFVQVLGRLLRNEGPLALFNGWLPTYCRLGPHAILTFPLYEAFRRLLGLDYL